MSFKKTAIVVTAERCLMIRRILVFQVKHLSCTSSYLLDFSLSTTKISLSTTQVPTELVRQIWIFHVKRVYNSYDVQTSSPSFFCILALHKSAKELARVVLFCCVLSKPVIDYFLAKVGILRQPLLIDSLMPLYLEQRYLQRITKGKGTEWVAS